MLMCLMTRYFVTMFGGVPHVCQIAQLQLTSLCLASLSFALSRIACGLCCASGRSGRGNQSRSSFGTLVGVFEHAVLLVPFMK